jgi:hypothetical protein
LNLKKAPHVVVLRERAKKPLRSNFESDELKKGRFSRQPGSARALETPMQTGSRKDADKKSGTNGWRFDVGFAPFR